MFEHKYKNAMDKIVINENALAQAVKSAITKPKSTKHTFKIALIACLSAAIIATSLFTVFKTSKTDTVPNLFQNLDNIQNGFVEDEDSSIENSDVESSNTESSDAENSDNSESDSSNPDSSNPESSGIESSDIEDNSSENSTTENSDVNNSNTESSIPENSAPENSDIEISEPDVEEPGEEPIVNPIPLSFSENGFKYAENDKELNEYLQNIFEQDDTVQPEEPSDPSDDADDNNLMNQNMVQTPGNTNCDTIMTDGKFVFVLRPSDNKITIVSAHNGHTEVLSEIKIESPFFAKKIVLINNTLAVICSSSNKTTCVYYDVKDKRVPTVEASVSQSGSLNICIASDGKVFLITTQQLSQYSNNIPYVNENAIDSTDIILSKAQPNNVTIITACDVASKNLISELAIFGLDNVTGIFEKNIYLAHTNINSDKPAPDLESATAVKSTMILKIRLNDGKLKPIATGCVDGVINDQFSISEKDSSLNAITTIEFYFIKQRNDGSEKYIRKTVKRVYCLNANLHIVGVSEDFATNRYILSAGFVGNIAYIRTSKSTNQFHAVDISNPEAPILISALEVCGINKYLHKFGDSHLMGINLIFDSGTGVTTGLELSLYNVKNQTDGDFTSTFSKVWDPGEYIEKSATYLENRMIIDSEIGLIGVPFCNRVYNESDDSWLTNIEYKLLTFDGENLVEQGAFEFSLNNFSTNIKAVRIDHCIYLITNSCVLSVSTYDFSIINMVEF